MSPTQLTDISIRRLTWALGLGLVIGLSAFLAVGERTGSSWLRGDFPAFYAAAEIVWSGQGAALYDHALQREIENLHWPEFNGDFYAFAYPPFFALLISPLAALPPLTAKALSTALLFAAVVAAMLLMRPFAPFFRQQTSFALLYLLTLAPLEISLFGAQNTALSILFLALSEHGRRSGRHWMTGMGAALLLYKPQFGVPLFLYLLARGQRGELRAWGVTALALYLLGIPVLGAAWPFVWAEAATAFGGFNFAINDHNMITLAGLIYWLSEQLTGDGASGLAWAYVLSTLLLLTTAFLVRRDPRQLVLVPSLILLLSPQTLFYDLGIAVFFLMRQLRPNCSRDMALLAAIWLYCAVAFVLREPAAFPFFAPALIAILWAQAHRAANETMSSPTDARSTEARFGSRRSRGTR
ncbi:glycosyltransferase family 87 protein [Thiorhodococcus minor]|uniref:DUF2029 domain-containing protein n=1 Tax=Thiorhodococcus minor TaxID=57489 RepID=A0A6M0K330_9GAMM|nr:glycosyltransferase family 87 protein [Thiorhodococcus minor]NEV63017.1 DUF2029 domain-containing protein [Thiorhodococcus minor]